MIKVSKEELNIEITDFAFQQILLIQENDFTIGEKVFRLKVDGKGCNGFDYAMGFTDKEKDDLSLSFERFDKTVTLAIDPFTAFYGKVGTIDYIQDFTNDSEGFHFENKNEKNYRGKFFKDESKLPEEVSSNQNSSKA